VGSRSVGCDTPEEAARGDIPPSQARAVAVSVSPGGDDAFVVLITNQPPYVEPYEVHCFRDDGRWFVGTGSGGLGLGWSNTSKTPEGAEDLGVLHLSGEAPAGVVEVVVRWREDQYRVRVSDGYFLFTAWDERARVLDGPEWPRAARYVWPDGRERKVPFDVLLWRARRMMRRRRRSGQSGAIGR
jgi:hypothetical protein